MTKVIAVPYRLDNKSIYQTLKKIVDRLDKKEQFVPSTSTSFGDQGQIESDGSYLYICISENQWKRVALSTF
jgi:hypothetical protein